MKRKIKRALTNLARELVVPYPCATNPALSQTSVEQMFCSFSWIDLRIGQKQKIARKKRMLFIDV